ncbi:unnamed protein product, partial [Vitis vinifera]
MTYIKNSGCLYHTDFFQIERETIKYHSTVIIMQEGHKLDLIRWKMCFWTILCSCIIRNPVNEILLTKNQRCF